MKPVSLSLEKLFHLAVHRKWSPDGKRFELSRVFRILVVRSDNLGDVLCSTPAIRALRTSFPHAFLAALVARYSQEAISGNPDIDELFTYEKAKHRPDRHRVVSLYKQFRVERELKRRRFDLAIGLRSEFSWSEGWLVYFSGAPFRLGYAPAGRQNRNFAFFYNLRIPPPARQHEVKKILHLVEAVGARTEEKKLVVLIPEAQRNAAESFLLEHGLLRRPLIGFHLSSRVPANRWRPENFADLAGRLIRHEENSVILTWAPGDEEQARKVRQRAGAGVFLFPTPTFKSLGALQERCRVFVTPDGAAMHSSTAVGTPTIGLFGKTDPESWGPWGEGHISLRRGKQADDISVEEVYQNVQKLIGHG